MTICDPGICIRPKQPIYNFGGRPPGENGYPILVPRQDSMSIFCHTVCLTTVFQWNAAMLVPDLTGQS